MDDRIQEKEVNKIMIGIFSLVSGGVLWLVIKINMSIHAYYSIYFFKI